MNLQEASAEILEGNLDNFDKAYNAWHKATVKLTVIFEKAATDKRAIGKFKKAIQEVEYAIDDGLMKD